MGAGLLGALAVVVGVVADWSAVAVLGAATAALVLACLAFVLRRPRLDLERVVEPPRVEKGRPAVVEVRVRNLARRPMPTLAVEQRIGSLVMTASLPRLRRGQWSARTYRLPTSRRGEFEIGPVEALRADPFGLCRQVQRFGHPDRLLVHPRLLELHPLATGASHNLEGPSSDAAPQGTVAFHHLREYVVGDDLRSVHWPSTARAGTLVVRHDVDTAQPYTVVLLDVRPEVYSAETFEEAVDVAASATVAGSAGKAPVQLCTTAGARVGGPRWHDPSAAVDFLARVQPSSDGSLQEQLTRLRRSRGGTALVVVSGRLEATSVAAAAGLRRRFDRVVLASLVAGTPPPPAGHGVSVLTAPDADALARVWNTRLTR